VASTPVAETFLTTSDHRRLGRMYVVAGLVAMAAGLVVGLVMEIQRADPGLGVVGNEYSRLFNLHATVTSLLFLPALWVGLAMGLVPGQIGASRLAFPRLAALAFWTYVSGGLCVVASFVIGRPAGAGAFLSQPLVPVAGGASRATALWAAGLIVVTVATVLAAANFFVTIVKLRADGMTMRRLPAFSWSVLITSVGTLLSAPAFAAGMLLVYLDQHYGGSMFAPSQVNANLVWQHLVWLYGRPEMFLVMAVALGALSDVVSDRCGGDVPPALPMALKAMIAGFGILSFGVLATGPGAASAVLLPTPTLLSAALLVPVGVCALIWLRLVLVRPRKVHVGVPLLYVVGFLALVAAGGLNAAIAPSQHLRAGTAWSTGQVHAVLFGAPMVAAFAAIYHWAPAVWGRALNALLGAGQWLLLLGGFVLSATGSWLAGYDGAPWHAVFLAPGPWRDYAKVSVVGGALVAAGLLVFVLNLAVTVLRSRQMAQAVA